MWLANENFPPTKYAIIAGKRTYHQEHSGRITRYFRRRSDQNSFTKRSCHSTLDRDYGKLIFRYSLRHPPAVVYFREKGNTSLFAGSVLIRLLLKGEIQFKNAFTVIEENNIRQRFY